MSTNSDGYSSSVISMAPSMAPSMTPSMAPSSIISPLQIENEKIKIHQEYSNKILNLEKNIVDINVLLFNEKKIVQNERKNRDMEKQQEKEQSEMNIAAVKAAAKS